MTIASIVKKTPFERDEQSCQILLAAGDKCQKEASTISEAFRKNYSPAIPRAQGNPALAREVVALLANHLTWDVGNYKYLFTDRDWANLDT